MKIYIIGNGFDIAHDLNTRYSDYYEYIRIHIPYHDEWKLILDYYPRNYEFWSNAEENVCHINEALFLSLKQISHSGWLDDLYRYVHDSFEKFIISAVSELSSKKRIFTIDRNAFFLNFNYTPTLEELYGVPDDHIIHLHGGMRNLAMRHFYKLNDDELVLGHSTDPSDYTFYSNNEIGHDTEYGKFIMKTTKNTDVIIKKHDLRGIFSRFQLANAVDEVVCFGFSCAPADQAYLRLILQFFSPKQVKYKFYFHVKNETSEESARKELEKNMVKSSLNPNEWELINDLGVFDF